MVTVVKVQRPIATSDPERCWLIYGKARRHVVYMPEKFVPPRVIAAMGEDYKAYFNARWSSAKGWELHDRVTEGGW